MGQPVWSLIYEAFSDLYFIEFVKLSCDHMSLFRLNHVVCRSILLCFFLMNTTGSFKIYQVPSLVTMHYDSYLR